VKNGPSGVLPDVSESLSFPFSKVTVEPRDLGSGTGFWVADQANPQLYILGSRSGKSPMYILGSRSGKSPMYILGSRSGKSPIVYFG
jgi:hypothetical protein